MSTSTYLGSKSSNGDTLHETLKTHPLLFRLHSSKYCHTCFDTERKLLLASSHAQKYANALRNGEDPTHILENLEGACSSSTLGEESELVAKHVTPWRDGNKDPSTFISLTFNVWFVYWEWKRRTHKHEDDFVIIVIKGSELDNKRAELATKILGEERRFREAFHFAQSAGEVIVKGYIPSQAILGSIPMSRLQEFIPSWCPKPLEPVEKVLPQKETSFKSFLDKIDASKAKCIQGSLRFALGLLAPMLVPSVVNSGAVTQSSAEGVNPSDLDTEKEYVPFIKIALESEIELIDYPDASGNLAAERKRKCSPESASTQPGTAEGGPSKVHPAKRMRLSEEDRPPDRPEDAAGPADTERHGPASAGPPTIDECEYVSAIAAGVWHSKGGWEYCRNSSRRQAGELLKRYRTAMMKDSEEPFETLGRVMQEYTGPF